MSVLPSGPLPVAPTEPIFPLSVEQYHTMIETGVLTDDDPVELLEGVLVFSMPNNPPHTFVVEAAAIALRSMLGKGWFYRQQLSITLADGEPEPDGAVVRGSYTEFRSRHPAANEVGLVIEASDATLARDRGIKLRSYARAGVQRYWIINIAERCIEIYTDPASNVIEPNYLCKQVVMENESAPVIIDGQELGRIAVRDLLP